MRIKESLGLLKFPLFQKIAWKKRGPKLEKGRAAANHFEGVFLRKTHFFYKVYIFGVVFLSFQK